MTKTHQPLGPFVLHTPSAGGVYRKSWESAASGETTVHNESDLAAFALAAAYAAAGLPCLVRPARDREGEALGPSH